LEFRFCFLEFDFIILLSLELLYDSNNENK